MKVQIVKYLNPKGKVVEMRKDNFKGRYLPENIIEEYEVEIKGEGSNEAYWLEDLKRKHKTGNYILLTPNHSNGWVIVQRGFWDCDNYKLIHHKHKDILEAYLKNPSVEIETGMFAPMTGETEPSKWVKLEKDFIEDYNEDFWYRLKVKDLSLNRYLDYNLNGISSNLERIRNRRFKIKKTLIDKIGLKLGLSSIDKEIFENFSNTLLRKILDELEEKEK